MGLGSFYAKAIDVNVKRSRFTRSLLVAGIALLALPFSGKAQTAPTFISSNPSRNMCNNDTFQLNSYLNVNDPDAGQFETYTISVPPNHGTLYGLDAGPSIPSGSTSIALTTPPVFYVPNPGYSGPESFQIQVSDNVDGTAYLNVSVTVSGTPDVTLGAFPSVCTGVLTATLPYTGTISNVGIIRDTFRFKGAFPYFFAVPTGVTSVNFSVSGGSGARANGANGTVPAGKGGTVSGALNVTGISLLNIFVGDLGDSSTPPVLSTTGGGTGSQDPVLGHGGDGGGSSDIRINGTAVSNRIIVGAGGGGNGWDAVHGVCVGGDGGGTSGTAGCTNLNGTFAHGGTPFVGGVGATYPPYAPGGNGSLYFGGNASTDGVSGGGGGGYFGGGGGVYSGGAGGSSYTSSSLTSGVTSTPGGNDGPGIVYLNYVTVGTYSISYDATAQAAGFVNVPATFPLPSQSAGFPVSIAPNTPAGTYHATLLLSNGICHQQYPFTIVVKQTPDVKPLTFAPVCNGSSVPVTFATTVGTTPVYTWSNSNTAIGAASSGTGSFTFTATNTGSGPIAGTFTVTPTEFGCTGAPMSFPITVNPQPGLTIAGPAQVCAGVTSAKIPFSNLVNVGTFSNTYSFLSGNTLPQVFNVPANVTAVNFDVVGGNGGSDDVSLAPNPGKGGRIQGVLNVTGGSLNIFVGGRGFNGSPFGAAGGYNGGGNGLYYAGVGCGGAGGGASDIRLNGTSLTDRVVVAGGGAGNGYDNLYGAYAGGDGGGLTGGNSANNIDGHFAGGGTQAAGGAGAIYTGQMPGGNGGFGFGGNGSTQGVSGGGGGGYFGGGGGVWTGGGGGSSYSDPTITTLVNNTPGYNIGDGKVTISYTTVGTYSISWTSAPGFTNVPPTALPDSAFTIAVPAATTAGTYTGTLTLDNGLCTKTFPISIIVNALPDVILTPAGNQVFCNNATTIPVGLSNTAASPTVKYYWTNDNTSIGLPAGDSTDTIPSFTAMNAGTTSQVANIVITPVEKATGCAGITATYTYSVNPTPVLQNLTGTSCSATPVNYTPSSLTPATKFKWSRDTATGISNSPVVIDSGTMVTEVLKNVTDAVPEVATYHFYLSANACADTQDVQITVNPTPRLSGITQDTVCSGTVFPNAAIEQTNVAGTSFSYVSHFASGFTVPAHAGSGAITDVLGNINTNPITVQYDIHTIAQTCFADRSVFILIQPVPQLTSGSSHTDAFTDIICSGSTFNYTAMSSTPGTQFSWNRISVAGISVATPNLGTDLISDVLVNTTSATLVEPYEFHLSINGCAAPTDSVLVTVDPVPAIMHTSTPDTAVCSGVAFTYTPRTNTPALGTTLTAIRPPAYGGPITGAITGTYIDTSVSPVTVPHYYTINYGTCSAKDTVYVTVNPIPKFTGALDTLFRCDLSSFPSYAPASSTSGATFAWSRPYVAGITNPAATGSGDLNSELLNNATNFSIPVVYTYTVSANGCVGAVAKLQAVIRPNPTLSSDLTPEYTCTGHPFLYRAASYVTGATFKWDRFLVNGIYGDSVNSTVKHYYSTNFGVGDVYETLYDTDYVAHRVLYLYRVTAYGCTNLTRDSVFVNVVPGPRLPAIVSDAALAPCSNTQFQTFSAATPPAAGVIYDWYANNATVFSSTADHQSVYVNFYNTGMSYVRLTGTTTSNACVTKDSVFVNVSTGVAENLKLVYYQSEFVCLRADMDSYQWGYDDIATFASVTIPGATLQNLYLPGADMQRYRYWVITTHNGCTQKTYYNAPLAVNEINTADVTDIRLYPNPTKDNINVLVNTTIDGKMKVELMDLLGQKLNTSDVVDHKATINVANLASGYYLIDCYRDGVKVGTSRFIKN